MARKTKVGKQRKDRFYHLAKETGYRSRAAFKLIQLNRKFEFLQKSRVLVDLCAAPGGWLQVARKFMPVSSVIVGIDLVPIKPIPNVISFQCDITTPECRQQLKKELKTWKADIFLNDGAPNVGKNWLHDAFSQIRLTLKALQLAAEFLMKGGWFITKVFRSKDYDALMWVFGKLFKRVHVTKPQASRFESAEIFVVCEKFLAPDQIDSKFFDANYVFEEVSNENAERRKKAMLLKKMSASNVEKTWKTKALGYSENVIEKLPVSTFVRSVNHIELLSQCIQIVFDNSDIADNPLTTNEIKELCKDIKVLGRKDLLQLIKWRKSLREEFKKNKKLELDEEEVTEKEPEAITLPEEEEVAETNELKKKRKKILKERRKLNERMNLNMVIKNDCIEDADVELFKLAHLQNKSDAETFTAAGELENNVKPKKKRVTFVDKDEYSHFDPDDSEDNASVSTENLHSDESDVDVDQYDDGDENEDAEESGLLVSLAEKESAATKRSLFFEKAIFKEMSDDDEDLEAIVAQEIKERNKSKKKGSQKLQESDEDSDNEEEPEKSKEVKLTEKEILLNQKCKNTSKLSVEGYALAKEMISSRKAREDLMDESWNRYTRGDEDLPSWFRKDEEKYNRKAIA
ncbi:hypothetical protein B4U80_03828, partial [Leptotrombidium deliense]